MGLHAQMTVRSHRSAWVQGWMVSAVIHAVLVAAVVMGIPAPQIIEMREAFRWEVSLVANSTAIPSHQDAPVLPSSSRSTTATHARQQATAVQQEAATAVTQQVTVARSVDTQPGQAVSMPTQFSEASHEQERRRTEETPVDTRVIEERKPVEHVRHEEDRREEVVVTEGLRTGEIVEASVATSTERVLSQAMPVERVPDLLSPRTRPHTPTSQERVEPAGLRPAAVLAGLLSRSTEGGASQQDQAPNASEGDGADATTPADRGGGNPFVRSSAVRSDYGWLAHTIRARMEEVKRYSIEARVNEWEGKVVISASILADGRIVDIQVVESSGNRRLDEDAKTMVGYVSPLTLSQSIGLAKVTVKVPIIFGLQ
ncbi:MAG: TonB family protein [Nitrospira sp.]|nr:TonB family protein [Nitrospira sp.]